MVTMSGGTSWNATEHYFRINISDSLAIRKSSLRVANSSFWVGLLLTVLCTFVVLSTPKQRSGVVFVIQCVSFTLALVYNVEELAVHFSRIRLQFDHSGHPIDWHTWNNAHVADLAFEHIVPIIADSAVIFKIRSFFPSPIYTLTQQMFVLAPLLVILIPRVIVTGLATHFVFKMENDIKWVPTSPFPIVVGFPWAERTRRLFQAEFGLGAIYSCYASVVLLIKAKQFSAETIQQDRNRLRRRLRFFAEATLMTFIPPVLFSITAAGVLDCPPDRYCYYREMAGTLLNVSVIFSLLATSWSSIRATYDQNNNKDDDHVGTIVSSQSRSGHGPRGVLAFFKESRGGTASQRDLSTFAGSANASKVSRTVVNSSLDYGSSAFPRPKDSADTLALSPLPLGAGSYERKSSLVQSSAWHKSPN